MVVEGRAVSRVSCCIDFGLGNPAGNWERDQRHVRKSFTSTDSRNLSPHRIPRKRSGIENVDGFGVGAQERRQLSVLQERSVVRVRDVVLAHQGVAVLRRRRHRIRRPNDFYRRDIER